MLGNHFYRVNELFLLMSEMTNLCLGGDYRRAARHHYCLSLAVVRDILV